MMSYCKMLKIVWKLHRCVFAIFAMTAMTYQSSYAQERPPTKIGAIVSLTGDAARNGLNWLEGAQVAADEMKEQGQKIELLVEDDQTSPSKVATTFVKLATIDKVSGIIGGTWDFLAEAAYPFAERYRIPFVTPTNPIEILSPAARVNSWIFTNGLSLGAERDKMKKFMSTRGIKSVGLVYINVPYGTSHADLVREISKEIGTKVVVDHEITYQGFQDGIKLAALKISQSNPDLVFVVLNYEGIDSLLREFEHLHISPLVLMTHTLKEAYDFGKSPQRYSKAFGVFPRFFSSDFNQRFVKKFGREPHDYAAAGYDALKFMATMIRTKGDAEIQNVKLAYDGITGQHTLPSSDRSVVRTEAAIMTMEEGKLVESKF